MRCLRYLSAPMLTCFDDPPPGDPPPGNPPPGDPNVTFTAEQQDKINKIQAEEKRKHQAQYQKIEKQLQDTLATAKLSQDERLKLEESLEDVRKQLRSKEEQAKFEKRQLEDQYSKTIQELEARASTAERRYTEATVTRALQDAASTGDAFNPDIVVTVLRPFVKMVDDRPMIDFPDVETETGNEIITQISSADCSRATSSAESAGHREPVPSLRAETVESI
jgi:hypothetical protein